MELTYTLRGNEAMGAPRQPHAEPGNACGVEVSAPADRGDVVSSSEREPMHDYQRAEALRCSPHMACVAPDRSQAAACRRNHVRSVGDVGFTSAKRQDVAFLW